MPAIIGLDLGVSCGWAIHAWDDREDGFEPVTKYGTWKLPRAKHDPEGARFHNFRANLSPLFGRCHPKDSATYPISCAAPLLVVYEKAAGGYPGSMQAQLWGAWWGILLAECHRRGIKAEGVYPTQLKKHIAQHGGADKTKIIGVIRQFGFEPKNDDEADALALLHYGLVKTLGTAKPLFEV